MRAPIPTSDDVAQVAATTDLVARNYQVTNGYYRFSTRLRETLADEATWPTFAAWASAQAGRTIRKEDLLRTLERRLGDSPAVRHLIEGPVRLTSRALFDAVLQLNPFERSSQAVARGKVDDLHRLYRLSNLERDAVVQTADSLDIHVRKAAREHELAAESGWRRCEPD